MPARAVYLQADREPVFALFHDALGPAPRGTAVLICPPFGWEETCSYRARREWAEHLAHNGHPTLRLDLPGSGDSAGVPSDPARLQAWCEAVRSAAGWLSERQRSRPVAAIGIGLGGLILCKAISDGAPIEQVALWATPARGSSALRELRAFARLEDTHDAPGETDGPEPGGPLWAGGFMLSAKTVKELDELDLTGLPGDRPNARRALLLDRDGIAPDKRLRGALEAANVEVSVAPGPGYAAMMAKPHHARAPRETFGAVLEWLGTSAQDPQASGNHAEDESADPVSTLIDVGGTSVRETPLEIAQPFGNLTGVLSEPTGGRRGETCLVMLNAGAIRRIGPNRMWVEVARRWATRGIPTLRLDVEGIGDADGDGEASTELAALYTQSRVEQVCAAMDTLERRGAGRRFVLIGLCSGAYWAFHGALVDRRATAAVMVNPAALFWWPGLEAARDYRRGALRPSTWPRVLRGEVSLSRILAMVRQVLSSIPRRLRERLRARSPEEDQVPQALDRLRETDKSVYMLFSQREPLREELGSEGVLEQAERWPNMRLEDLPGAVHTLRPAPTQASAHAAIDRAIGEELEREPAPSPELLRSS